VTADRGLLFDYGGVLTGPVGPSFAVHERELGIRPGRSFELLVEASRTPGGGPIGALERGELSVEEFDALLLGLLRDDGHELEPEGSLLGGLFAAMQPDGRLWEVAAAARDAGVRTGLLSNSWGTGFYPWDRLDEHFDVTVISGQVGLRKPDPAIYELAVERLGVAPDACAFVDDLERNVEVARELGMFGVWHTGDDAATAAALAGFLEVDLDASSD
jgi:epoxide hydrolase-like predicted phosphatase